jgi:hypothetical protein
MVLELNQEEIDLLKSILQSAACADKNSVNATGMFIKSDRESKYFNALFQKITNKSIEDYISSFTDFKNSRYN